MYGELSRKNIFYDLKFGSNKIFLDINSVLRPLNIDHISNAVMRIIEESGEGIYNICNPNSIKVSEILNLKNIEFNLIGERYINESNISAEKFEKFFGFKQDKNKLLEDINQYISNK
ncbi:MAG: hypothetical protein RL621_1599 [Bacteroidota bacterium]|jgi:hypothetical protein